MGDQAQGSLGQLLIQIQDIRGQVPSAIATKKLYFSTESIVRTQELERSEVQRGGVRHPTRALRGRVDVGGDINTELMATSALLYAACGSMETTMAGGTMGAALAAPTGVIDAVAQTLTITQATHGQSVGGSMEITSLTAPTSLNGKIWPIVAVPDADTLVLRIPAGTTTTFTLGAGAIKPVTAAGVCTHTIKAGGKLPYYFMEKGFTDLGQYLRYLDSVCGKLSFSIGATGAIKLDATWMACSEQDPETSSLDIDPLDNLKTSFDNLGIAAANIKEGGTAVANILGIDTIQLENNLDGDTFVVGGQGARSAINAAVYSVTGTMRAMFDSIALYEKAKNSTVSSIDFTVTRGSGDGTSGNESLQVVIPELIYQAKSPVINGPKGVRVELGFEADYTSNSDQTAMKFIVKNSLLPGAMI